MSAQETTPLLAEGRGLPLHVGRPRAPEAAPFSLHVCRSAWPWPTQRGIVFVRGAVLAYLTGLGPILFRDKISQSARHGQSPWGILFDFSAISHVLQWLWYLVSFSWSLIHHHHTNNNGNKNIRRRLVRIIMDLHSAEQAELSPQPSNFSLLYTAALVFNFVDTGMYWAVPAPGGYVDDGSGGHAGNGWLRIFMIANVYGVTTLIASSEVMFLNTIKHENGIASHVFSIVFLLSGYLGWAAIGNTMTGRYPFFWMDPALVGSARLVARYATGFVALGPAAFAVVYGLTWLRGRLARYRRQPERYNQVDQGDERGRPTQRGELLEGRA